MTSRIRFDRVHFRYGGRVVLDRIDLDVPVGSFSALVGSNGAGKTTLLELASGALQPSEGQVTLDGRDLRSVPPRERGRRIAVVPQSLAIAFDYTVRELVALGRTPHFSWFGREGPADRDAIARALSATETEHLAERSVLHISSGERQRVLLALALAQQPDVLLLDEPTANLDVAHQAAILELVREWNRASGLTVLAAIHDLNLATLFFDRVVALSKGRLIADGNPREVVTPRLVAEVFGAEVVVIEHPSEGVPLVALRRRTWSSGEGPDR